jgi:hypothetical protein
MADNAVKTHSFKHNGKTYTIPLFADVPMGALRKARKAQDDGDKVFIILEEVLPEGNPALAAIDTMNGPTFAEFLKGWTQGAPLGE